MKRHESIQKIMTDNPVTLQLGQKLSEASAIFRQHNIHHIPVMNHNQPVGMLSETDLLRLVYDAANTDSRMQDTLMDQQHSIADVMSDDLQTLPMNATVKEAAEILSDSNRHSVLVTDGTLLAGIVTSTDLIRYLHEQF
ncbi:CBS domain-containing protein [Endozoicomonas elysicola]|uniref:CBS domain-containing protein n=1 Tax=Endozoicomonas elysicola TaxID=305900 RepID=A0A081KAL5_9GAMM|nr:CBS domain-containing protein [Endozoicomonas elysicola]KEI71191.1 hypothetical protein GV64_10955 [Endozoicomonas elysicola]